ncbi:MAG: ABC transporter ATP-binding protein [Pseudomonadota bacterium]
MNIEAPSLIANNLGYRTSDGQVLLEGVSLSLEAGTVCAIAGPNGAGKTTLLNLLSGLLGSTSGKILINGKDIKSFNTVERARKIAVVSQHSTPDARLSVRDYVALGQLPIWANHCENEHAAALRHTLVDLDLAQMEHKPIGKISGGEQQRAHIARALVQKPQFLFLDEPTNHLDPEAKGRILSRVATAGLSVVMVMHDLVMIPEFANYVALLKDAQLTAFGPVSEVQTPKSVRKVFGVDYRLFHDDERQIPALDIRKINRLTNGIRAVKPGQ